MILHYKHKTEDYTIGVDTFHNGNIIGGDFDPVYAFDYEDELNEDKREIRLLDKRYSGVANDNLKRIKIKKILMDV